VTNACELRCPFCYAPKRPARLQPDEVLSWARELDAAGGLGIGFGGGEPTAHPELGALCAAIAERTSLAVSMTTHAHRFDASLAARLRGSVHFVRVSVDGLGATYEAIRGRPFAALERKLELVATVAPFGINCVVTEQTIDELDACLAWAERVGAQELLLLAEQPVGTRPGLAPAHHERLTRWVAQAAPSIRLAVGAMGATAEMGLADPFGPEPALEGHAHVDASRRLRPDAYSELSVDVGDSIIEALGHLDEEMKR
jgi:MoaA/NifB/PqqE/SkfB family radical SAM enzyme